MAAILSCRSSTTWTTMLKVASQSWRALSTMASKTGRSSVGELEMTRRISLVAICCLRMSLRECPVLLLQRGEQSSVLDCDDPLVSEGRHQLDFFVTKSALPGLNQASQVRSIECCSR